MKTNLRTLATRSALALSLSAFAYAPLAQADSHPGSILEGWQGSATLGANQSSGNAESSSINGAIRLGKTVGRWEHILFGSVVQGDSALVVTNDDGTRSIVRGDNSDRLALGYTPRYYLSDSTYLFAILDYEEDEPANIDQATRQILGAGRRFFSNDSGFLTGEIGIGNKATNVVSGDDFSGAIGYLGINYLNRFTETASFTADFRSDFGSENTFIELGLGLQVRVSNNLSLQISHFTRNNSDLISTENPLASSTDVVTSFGIVFDIQ